MKLNIYALILLAIVATTSTFIQTGSVRARSATALPTVYVSPLSKTVQLGDRFSIDVDLDNASNLYGYEIWLSFDPDTLNATALEYKGYLNEPTQLWAQTINDTAGYVDFAISSHLPAQAKNGGSPPPLVTINFTAKALGTSTLHLVVSKTKLVSSLNDGAPIPHQTADGTVTVLQVGGQPQPVAGMVGITGFKLVFKETMNNPLGSPATIDYYWNFSMDKWNGAQWIASGISGSSAPAVVITGGFTTVDLPYYVYLLNSSGLNAVTWGDWLRIDYTFHWTYSSTNYAVVYVAKLHVHPADFAGVASVAFPYLGADFVVNSKDVSAIATNWLTTVPMGTDPTSLLGRSDINADGTVNSKDIALIAANWLATWTNTPPP